MRYLNRTAVLGENTSDNRFNSSEVTANKDGSALERLEALQQESTSLADFVLIDKDDFDVADADANTDRWNIGYLWTGSEGGGADISTTTSGKLMVEVDPDATPTEAFYGVDLAVPVYGDVWQVIVDMDATWGTMGTTGCAAGLLINKTTTIANDQNQLRIFREKSSTVNRIGVSGKLNNVGITQTNAAVTDDALAWKIERWDETYRFYYSLLPGPNYTWVLHTQIEDASNYLTNEIGIFLFAYSKGSTTAETIVADFDNFKVYAGAGGGGQYIAGDYSSAWVTDDADGNVLERLEALSSDVMAIEKDTTSLISDLLVHDSDVMSDLEVIMSDLVIALSDIKASQVVTGHFATKTIAYDGSVSYAAFTVTGLVNVQVIGHITGALSNHGDATSVGTATSAAGLIASTAGTAMQTAGQVWVDNAPAKFETFAAASTTFLIGDGEDIAVVGTANLGTGTVILNVIWTPITSDGNVVAAV